MKYKLLFKDDYYNGAVADPNGIDVGLPDDKNDEYGNLCYKFVDGKIILNPQKPTTEQLEAKRKQLIVEEIRKKYTIDDELAILFRGTKEEKDKHEADVTAIKMGAT